MPMSLAIRIPCSNASYSAILFVVVKWICNTYRSLSPWGDLSTTPAPEPPRALDPSKYRVQYSDSGRVIFSFVFVQSATKSARIWDLIVVQGLYSISKAESSMPHLATHPVASLLLIMSLMGALLTMVIGCS